MLWLVIWHSFFKFWTHKTRYCLCIILQLKCILLVHPLNRRFLSQTYLSSQQHLQKVRNYLVKQWNNTSQCPRTDLNKRFLPRPKTTTAWNLIPQRSKISKNWNPPHWVSLHRFFKNWFLLYKNSFTVITFKLVLLSKKNPNV